MSPAASPRWLGLCAGGFFAAAAVYLGNMIVLLVGKPGNPLPNLAIGVFPAACSAMGGLLLSEKAWVPRWAVVVAVAFVAIHLIGLVYLFEVSLTAASSPARLLQWQLGGSLLCLWFGILACALRVARGAGPALPAHRLAHPIAPRQDQGWPLS